MRLFANNNMPVPLLFPEVFKHKDPKGTGVATFNTEEYVNVTMYS